MPASKFFRCRRCAACVVILAQLRTAAIKRRVLPERRLFVAMLLGDDRRLSLRTVPSVVRCISRVMAVFAGLKPQSKREIARFGGP